MELTISPRTSVKRKKFSKKDKVDEYILESLKGLQEKRACREEDQDELFGRQVAAKLRGLPEWLNAQAKINILQLLMDIEFPTKEPVPLQPY